MEAYADSADVVKRALRALSVTTTIPEARQQFGVLGVQHIVDAANNFSSLTEDACCAIRCLVVDDEENAQAFVLADGWLFLVRDVLIELNLESLDDACQIIMTVAKGAC